MKDILNSLAQKMDSYRYLHIQIRNSSIAIPYLSSKPGNCGITCVMMLLQYHDVKIRNKNEFINKYKTPDNYTEPIGWKHKGLVNVLKGNGVNSKRYKYKSLHFVLKQILKSKPVIVSLRIPGPDNVSQKKLFESIEKSTHLEGHLCIAKGIKDENLVIHDPRNNGIYTKNLEVPFITFEKIFSGNCIC